MTDSAIGAFLASRRKFITGILGVASILTAGGLVPDRPTTQIIQGIVGFLTVYGIHEIANDSTDSGLHSA